MVDRSLVSLFDQGTSKELLLEKRERKKSLVDMTAFVFESS